MKLRMFSVLSVSVSIFVALFTIQCLSLDPFLFNGEEVKAYHFDHYTGKRECSDAIEFLGPYTEDQTHEFTIQSGEDRIAAVLLSSSVNLNQSDTIILYLHGRSHHIDYYWPRARLLHQSGYPVLIIDYRGFGKSSGTPTEERLFEDGFSALSFLRDVLGNPNVVVYGYSLGSLIACKIASQSKESAIISLILEAPIGSVATLVKDASYLDLPASYLTTYTGNNASEIKHVQIPLLWLHGTEDETLKLETNGMPIWNNYEGPRGYGAIVDGATHADIPDVVGYELYMNWINSFICGEADQFGEFLRK